MCQRSCQIKSLSFSLIIIIFITAISIIVGGKAGLILNEKKIENIDNNPIYVELSQKVKSGELELNKEVGLSLIQGMRDAHFNAGLLLDSFFEILIYIGVFLTLIVSLLTYCIWKLNKANLENST
jgi:hypothetical protein